MIYTFAELEPGSSSNLVGGKGANLSRLYQAGYRVPDGVILTPQAFSDEELKPEAWEKLKTMLPTLRNGRTGFAVRSSAIAEDSAHASFAGEFESVLDVRSDEAVRRAIKTVRQSRYHERVKAYSQVIGIDAAHEIAVVIQQMVPSEISGVLFTADPVTGSYANMVGNFARGLGDQLVSGEMTGESFWLKRPLGRYQGPSEMKKYGRRLYKMANRLEKDLGGPQDIEFAIADGKLYLLQARPITTLRGYNPQNGEWNDSLRGDYLWSNTNFGEAMPDVMTPFTWSIFQIYFQETFPYKLPGDHPLGGNIGGRFYANISLFASLVAALKLDPRKMLKNDETIGNIPEEIEIPIIPFSFSETIHIIFPLIIKARRRVLRLRKELPTFLEEVRGLIRENRAFIQSAQNPAELAEVWRNHLEPFLRQSSRMLQASMSRLQDSSGKLRRDLIKLAGEEDVVNLMSGVGDLESLGPILGLAKVAHGKMSRQEYIEKYGHRGSQEAELSVPRPAEDPAWIESQLTQIDEQTDFDPEALLASQQAQHEEAWSRLATRHPRRAASLREELDLVAEASRVREKVRSELTRMLWVIRDFALHVGRLTGYGESIFFLSVFEVITLLEGDDSVVSAISLRRKAYDKFKSLPPYPSIINGRFDPIQWAEDPQRRNDIFDGNKRIEVNNKADIGNIIKGFPSAVGVVEGIVKRLDSPDEGGELKSGEILVTHTTNIGWTPIFPRAAAIVTDVGAPLSHAAIVARELGIPAVVGCGNATMHLQTGDWVRVDGGQGTVELL